MVVVAWKVLHSTFFLRKFLSKGAAIKFFLCKVFHVFKFSWLEYSDTKNVLFFFPTDMFSGISLRFGRSS